ncbi:MAG: hypothetical protein IGS39_15345 [Calothrix sp. C42_A2020_038]|nr:hypothetical protein [Calothrix sp. C42_A2020_038]
MRYIFLSILLPFCLESMLIRAVAGKYKSRPSTIQNPSSRVFDSFDTIARGFMQEQIYLIARIENALLGKDPNHVRAVRGQILVQAKAIEGFIKQQDSNFKTSCTLPLSTKETKIYISRVVEGGNPRSDSWNPST